MGLGYCWPDLLIEGEFQSVGELSEKIGMDPSQLCRHIRLTCLAPDLIRMILDGREPDGVSLEQLAREMPGEWEKQRRLLQKLFSRDLS